jgi:hypothetical protein
MEHGGGDSQSSKRVDDVERSGSPSASLLVCDVSAASKLDLSVGDARRQEAVVWANICGARQARHVKVLFLVVDQDNLGALEKEITVG